MQDLIPQVDLEAEIMRLSGLLDQATRKILQRALRSARADSDYKREYSKAYLTVDGKNAAEKEARVLTSVTLEGDDLADLYDDRKIAEAVLVSAQEAARNLRAQISALQTLSANQRFLLERG